MAEQCAADTTVVIEDPSLFDEMDLDAFREHKHDAVRVALERYDQAQLLVRSTAEIAETIVARHRVEAPRIDESGIYYTLSRSHRGAVFKFHVPYSEDSSLFRLRPSKPSVDPPRGVVEAGRLVITVIAVGYDGKAIRAAVDDDLAKLNHFLARLRADVNDLNAAIGAHAEKEIETRRKLLLVVEQMERDIGYPKRLEKR
jgi:hypothetical protein